MFQVFFSDNESKLPDCAEGKQASENKKVRGSLYYLDCLRFYSLHNACSHNICPCVCPPYERSESYSIQRYCVLLFCHTEKWREILCKGKGEEINQAYESIKHIIVKFFEGTILDSLITGCDELLFVVIKY